MFNFTPSGRTRQTAPSSLGSGPDRKDKPEPQLGPEPEPALVQFTRFPPISSQLLSEQLGLLHRVWIDELLSRQIFYRKSPRHSRLNNTHHAHIIQKLNSSSELQYEGKLIGTWIGWIFGCTERLWDSIAGEHGNGRGLSARRLRFEILLGLDSYTVLDLLLGLSWLGSNLYQLINRN